MTRTEVVIRWLAEDVQHLRPEWSLDDCETVLEKFGRALTDRSIEVGWEILEVLLSIEEDEMNEEGERFVEEFYKNENRPPTDDEVAKFRENASK
jgi:hypothetical protein